MKLCTDGAELKAAMRFRALEEALELGGSSEEINLLAKLIDAFTDTQWEKFNEIFPELFEAKCKIGFINEDSMNRFKEATAKYLEDAAKEMGVDNSTIVGVIATFKALPDDLIAELMNDDTALSTFITEMGYGRSSSFVVWPNYAATLG